MDAAWYEVELEGCRHDGDSGRDREALRISDGRIAELDRKRVQRVEVTVLNFDSDEVELAAHAIDSHLAEIDPRAVGPLGEMGGEKLLSDFLNRSELTHVGYL